MERHKESVETEKKECLLKISDILFCMVRLIHSGCVWGVEDLVIIDTGVVSVAAYLGGL